MTFTPGAWVVLGQMEELVADENPGAVPGHVPDHRNTYTVFDSGV